MHCTHYIIWYIYLHYFLCRSNICR